jgi:hypothetical protein
MIENLIGTYVGGSYHATLTEVINDGNALATISRDGVAANSGIPVHYHSLDGSGFNYCFIFLLPLQDDPNLYFSAVGYCADSAFASIKVVGGVATDTGLLDFIGKLIKQ